MGWSTGVLLASLVLVLSACKQNTPEVSALRDDETTVTGPAGPTAPAGAVTATNVTPQTVPDDTSACASVCTGVTDIYNGGDTASDGAKQWAACYSCRCKLALGRLPTRDEMKCSNAEGPLVRWRSVSTDGRMTGTEIIPPNATDTTGCLNRGIAAAGCDMASRFRRFPPGANDTLEFQFLCRKPLASQTTYYEYLLIGHNQKNGATCFWQASSSVDGENMPDIDLTGDKDTPANRAAYAGAYYLGSNGDGRSMSTCTNCHANDAFIWSPYFTAKHPEGGGDPVDVWPLGRPRNDLKVKDRIAVDRKYFTVSAGHNALQAVNPGDDLTRAGGPMENDCGECHRVTKTSDYCDMAKKAVGTDWLGAHGAEGYTHARRFLNWMPPLSQNTRYPAFAPILQRLNAACQGA